MSRVGIVEASVVQEAAESDAERIRRIARAWDHYQNGPPAQLPVSPDGHDDNVRINYAELIVDKGSSFLFGPAGLTFQVEEDEAGATLARLDEEWPLASRSIALHQLAVNGGVTGHAILRLKRDPTRVYVVDPGTFEAEWDDEDISNVLRYTITWNAADVEIGEATARRQRFEPFGNIWVVYDEISDAEGDNWRVVSEERWPYPWPPIFDCQHLPAPNEYWGKAQLEPDVLNLIETLSLVASRMVTVVRRHSHPVPYVIGKDAKNTARLDVSLGQILAIPDPDAKVGQLELNADLTSSMTLWRELRDALHEVSKIPEVATGKLSTAGAQSGVALSILYGPAVELGSMLRLTYGPMLASLAARILEMAGQRDLVVTPQWANIIPEDREADATRDEAELRMRVISRQTVAERRGYDWEEENRRISQEAEAGAQAALDAFNRGAGGGQGIGEDEDDEDEDEELAARSSARIPLPAIKP